MRVAVYYNNADVRVEERPVPDIGPGEALVKVLASGLCGSDVMEWYRIKKAPLVLGHEICGEVVETGQGVDLPLGRRVFVSHHVPCNTCRYCLAGKHTLCDMLRSTNFDPGGFSEYLRAPAINVDRGFFAIPDCVSDEDATFVEPLACALRGQRMAGLAAGQTVLVLGAGISGMLHIALAASLGAGRILATDVSEYRLNKAREFGAHAVCDGRGDVPAFVREHNQGRGADLVIVCAGAIGVYEQALASCDRGATICLYAPATPGECLPLDLWPVWKEGIRLIPTYGAAPVDIEEAIRLLEFGRVNVNPMITHRLGMGEAPLGFRLVAESADSLKVIIFPQVE